MRFLYDDGASSAELDLEVRAAGATVADLAAALGERPGPLLIGRHVVGPDLALDEAGFHEGVAVSPSRVAPSPPTVHGGLELVVVGGLVAGARHRLASGAWSVGRDPGCDVVIDHPTVSGRHCTVVAAADGTVTVTDAGSHNGTWVDGEAVLGARPLVADSLVRVGGVVFTVGPVPDGDRSLAVDALRHVTSAGTMPFNRPPRPAPPPPPVEISPPSARREPGRASPFSIAAFVAPLVMGGVMAIALEPGYALFMLLSPVMAVGSWLESKRRSKKDAVKGSKQFKVDLQRFEEALATARAVERQRRWEAVAPPSELVRRAGAPSVRLWERRPGHRDFLQLHVGIGEVPWEAPVARTPGERPAEVDEVLAAAATLPQAPVHVDLADGGVVGVVGERPAALALARSLLCQAAAQSGPADLAVAVACDPDRVADWDWTKWLPHTRDPGSGGGARLLAGSAELADVLLRSLADRDPGGERVTLVVLDADGVTAGRDAPARAVLRGEGGPVAGIVLAATEHELPALCTTVVELDGPHGRASLRRPQRGEGVDDVLVAGLTDRRARRCARSLAPFEDPELSVIGAGLPSGVPLVTMLGVDAFDPDALLAVWRAGGTDPGLDAVLGMGEAGPFHVDLVRDGPHGLIGGTTGSGKSELLRTLVASLATTTDPDHLTFVLVDYKGGAAFDECARLPHTVGLVTDLDEHLGERALRCLEAELHHRERRLRASGATDLPAYLRLPASLEEPMPRLVVVIDEFATMKAELPDFVDALVGIAQRGRSLGVHLLLATQRPSGAVSENIKANTNLRIALRVQDAADSTDIIGTAEAAAIAREQAGRAYLRLGPGEIVPIQTALVTGRTELAATAPVDVAPFRFGRRARGVPPSASASSTGSSDLVRLVEAARQAFQRSGAPAPRRPWPEPLPEVVDLRDLDDVDARARGVVPVALGDDPDRQAQQPIGWDTAAGNLILYGIGGSGTTTALAALALSLARARSADDLHLYVLDLGAGELGPLARLPHTGAVVLAPEAERQQRLIRWLRAELDRRRGLADGGRHEPEVVVLLDGFGAFSSELDDVAGMALLDAFTRVVADGPRVGIRTVIAADRVGAVPAALASTVAQKWLFRLADAYDYGSLGVSGRAVASGVPGRGVSAPAGQVFQVGRPSPSIADAVDAVVAASSSDGGGPARRPPVPVATLPELVDVATLVPCARLDGEPWLLPVGIGSDALAPVGFTLYEGEHALVAGPPRSGRSTALAAIARLVRAVEPSTGVVALTSARSPLRAHPDVDAVVPTASDLAGVVAGPGRRWLVLLDDVERLDDVDGTLERLATTAAHVHIVAAGRADTLRTLYGHWTRTLRRSKVGVLLQPDHDLDGELLGVTLPRRSPVAMGPGRGWLVCEGGMEVVQLATAVDRSQRANDVDGLPGPG